MGWITVHSTYFLSDRLKPPHLLTKNLSDVRLQILHETSWNFHENNTESKIQSSKWVGNEFPRSPDAIQCRCDVLCFIFYCNKVVHFNFFVLRSNNQLRKVSQKDINRGQITASLLSRPGSMRFFPNLWEKHVNRKGKCFDDIFSNYSQNENDSS